MPRTGVSYDNVVESIHVLEKAGLNASIRNIRERIGKGSLTTIAEHKREYELTTSATPREALPDPIAKGLLSGAEAYWQELVDAAEAEIAKIQGSADETLAVLSSRVSGLEAELADAQEALNGECLSRKAVEDTLAAAESAKSDGESQLQAKSTELSAMAARLDETRLVTEKANSDRDQLDEQLKEAQGEVAKLIERSDNAASKHASELARLNTELAKAVASNESLGEQLESAKQAAEKAAQETRENAARVNTAERECKAAQETVIRLRDDLEQQRGAAAESRSELEARLASQTALVDEKDARINDLQSANSSLHQALKSRKKPKKKKQGT
jgi:chromosome segregation ATPase